MSSRLEDPRVLPLSYDKYKKRMETGAGDTVRCNAPCDFFNALIEALDNDKDVFEYQSDTYSHPFFGKMVS